MIAATAIVGLAGLYLLAGLVVAASALIRGLGRLDPAAENATIGFRLLMVPGLILMWPVIVRRLRSGEREPPSEKTPHKRMWRSS